jgi:hypothetical protein
MIWGNPAFFQKQGSPKPPPGKTSVGCALRTKFIFFSFAPAIIAQTASLVKKPLSG